MKYPSTTERAPALRRELTGPRAAGLEISVTLLVGLVALLPRLFGLADFLTTDEAYHWISRTERFVAAVGAGRWGDTILTGHPGVTLMWLGGLGLRFEQLALATGWAAPPDRLAHLAWLRSGPVIAHALAVSGGYALLRRLVRPGVALVAALLWASSPYLVAHGRLLHLDALLADLCTLTVLSVLVACGAARPLRWLLLAGVLGGLALLTKGPALIVLPFVGLAMFVLGSRRQEVGGGGLVIWMVDGLRWSLSRYALWLAVAALTAFLLWPALWVAPQLALERYWGEIVGNGGRPNGDGQFFLGRSDADPGPLFYPLASLYRLTPVELLGLALYLLFTIYDLRFIKSTHYKEIDRHGTAPSIVNCKSETGAKRYFANVHLLALGGFVLFWALVMTLGPKKFDRYLLPAWPALLTLGAAGLVWGWERLQAYRHLRLPAARLLLPAVGLLLQAGLLLWYHPYYLSYYSPLFGGGPAAQRSFLIGWGEGMDQVGAWLRTRPDIAQGQILSALPPTLQPFVPVPVQEVSALDSVQANYAVVYLESLQRGDAPQIYQQLQSTVPLHTVRIHGIEYAHIYQLARPFATPLHAEFGGALRLAGYTVSQAGVRLTLTPAWDVRAPLAGDYLLFAHLYDAAGTRVAQIAVAPGGASAPWTSQWIPGAQIAVPLPIDLPVGLPAGQYRLTLGLFEPTSGARLPLSAGPAADPALAGDNAALLGELSLVAP